MKRRLRIAFYTHLGLNVLWWAQLCMDRPLLQLGDALTSLISIALSAPFLFFVLNQYNGWSTTYADVQRHSTIFGICVVLNSLIVACLIAKFTTALASEKPKP